MDRQDVINGFKAAIDTVETRKFRQLWVTKGYEDHNWAVIDLTKNYYLIRSSPVPKIMVYVQDGPFFDFPLTQDEYLSLRQYYTNDLQLPSPLPDEEMNLYYYRVTAINTKTGIETTHEINIDRSNHRKVGSDTPVRYGPFEIKHVAHNIVEIINLDPAIPAEEHFKMTMQAPHIDILVKGLCQYSLHNNLVNEKVDL